MIERLYDIYRDHPEVTTDTRTIRPGSLFFALKGENFDGNRFTGEALEKGAAYCITDDPEAAAADRCILVGNVLDTLQRLALHHRVRLGIPVLALTGSNGKTTTKELVRSVLARKYRVASTKGNLNNHIGIPLTLLSIRPDDELAIVEMGANHRGEIASYCGYTRPDYGIVTNIGKAHLEGFGGIEGVKAGKGELFAYLARNGGTAFCAEDDPHVMDARAQYPDLKTVYYRVHDKAVTLSPYNELAVEYRGEPIKSHLVGAYNAANIAAAVCIGEFFGVEPVRIREGIEGYVPENFRSQRVVAGENILYLDLYNANPSSMEAALENFRRTEEKGYGKIAILGEMLELGPDSEPEHKKIVNLADQAGFGKTIFIGMHFQKAIGERNTLCFDSAEKAAEYIRGQEWKKKAVLLKGSRGVRLEKIADLLRK